MIKKHQYNPSEKTNLIKWGIVTPKKKNIFKNMNHVMNMGIIMLMEIVVLPWETLCQTSGHALYVLVVSLNLNRLKQNNSCSKKIREVQEMGRQSHIHLFTLSQTITNTSNLQYISFAKCHSCLYQSGAQECCQSPSQKVDCDHYLVLV